MSEDRQVSDGENTNDQAELEEFGFPIYVPTSPSWRILAVDLSNGKPSGVLVMPEDFTYEVRTASEISPHQPLSVQVRNVQLASLDGADRSLADGVGVDDEESEVFVDGMPHGIRVLKSHRVFRFMLRIEDRTVHVAGRLDALPGVALSRLDALEAAT